MSQPPCGWPDRGPGPATAIGQTTNRRSPHRTHIHAGRPTFRRRLPGPMSRAIDNLAPLALRFRPYKVRPERAGVMIWGADGGSVQDAGSSSSWSSEAQQPGACPLLGFAVVLEHQLCSSAWWGWHCLRRPAEPRPRARPSVRPRAPRHDPAHPGTPPRPALDQQPARLRL